MEINEITMPHQIQGAMRGGGIARCYAYYNVKKLISTALKNPLKKIASMSATKRGRIATEESFKFILQESGLWKEEKFNRLQHSYTFDNGSVVDFVTLEEPSPDKLKGYKFKI